MADYWGKKFNDRLKLVEKELQLKEAKQSSSRFEMLRDVLNEKSNESAESYTDTPTTLTDNAEETIMIKGRVPRTIPMMASMDVQMWTALCGSQKNCPAFERVFGVTVRVREALIKERNICSSPRN